MRPVIAALCAFVASLFQSRWAMQLKILALQHQVAVYNAPEAPAVRSPPVGLALAPVASLATGAGVHAAPDRARVAKEAISRLLARFESEEPPWATCHGSRSPSTHPGHVAIQSHVGITSYRG